MKQSVQPRVGTFSETEKYRKDWQVLLDYLQAMARISRQQKSTKLTDPYSRTCDRKVQTVLTRVKV